MINRDKNTTSGGRVILAVFGGILVFSVLVLLGFLYFSPDAQPCANGEEAKNPESQPGVPLPREETVATIEDAERFICHRIQYPRDESLTLQKITAFRTSSLEDVVEANAYAEVRLQYLHAPSRQLLHLSVSPYDLSPSKSTTGSETLRFSGQTALLTHSGPEPDSVQVDWTLNSLTFHAQTQLSGGMSRETLVALLESIR